MQIHKHHIYVYPSFERGLNVTNDILIINRPTKSVMYSTLKRQLRMARFTPKTRCSL